MAKKEGQTPDLPPLKLTPKEQKFVEEYHKTGNGKLSARKAGYRGTDGSLCVKSSRLLRKGNVRQYLRYLQEDARLTHKVDRDWIINQLKETVLFDPEEVVTKNGFGQLALQKNIRAGALRHIELTTKLTLHGDGGTSESVGYKKSSDRLRALEMLGKITGVITNGKSPAGSGGADTGDRAARFGRVLSALRGRKK